MLRVTTIYTFLFAVALLPGLSTSLWAADTTDTAEIETVEEGNVWETAEGARYFTCPVMKGELAVKNAQGYSDYNGKRYYHCCPPCQAPFRANPEKWLSELALPENVARLEDGAKVIHDPVSHEEALVSEETPYVDYEGKRYYFASEETRDRFLENPKPHSHN